MGQRRKHFVVVPLDSDFALPQATSAVKALLQELRSAGLREDVGLGVLSMLGFDSTSDHMQVRPAACCLSLSLACPVLPQVFSVSRNYFSRRPGQQYFLLLTFLLLQAAGIQRDEFDFIVCNR